jgi:hypothetical protein
MDPKFGFGKNKKMHLRQSMPRTHWAHFGAFLFCIMMGRKMTSRKGSVSPLTTVADFSGGECFYQGVLMLRFLLFIVR